MLPQSIVDAAPLLQTCAGVVIEVGNPTDHLSCIAREYGVPMITGAQTALSSLGNGQWVIVDADQGVVVDAPESIRVAVALAHSEQRGRMAGIQADPTSPRALRHTVISAGTAGFTAKDRAAQSDRRLRSDLFPYGVQVNPRYHPLYP